MQRFRAAKKNAFLENLGRGDRDDNVGSKFLHAFDIGWLINRIRRHGGNAVLFRQALNRQAPQLDEREPSTEAGEFHGSVKVPQT